MANHRTAAPSAAARLTPIVNVISLLTALVLVFWTTHAAFAHEGRVVGGYNLTVGFFAEPAIEGQKNGVQLRVVTAMPHGDEHEEEGSHEEAAEATSEGLPTAAMTETTSITGTTPVTETEVVTETEAAEEHADEEEHSDEETTDHAHAEAAAPVPVEGLEETLQVEVTHIASNVSKVMALRAVWNDPGHYTNDWIPTAPGAYRFRFFGTIEGLEIDETFESGEGTFSAVEPATDLYFPEPQPQMREVSGAARGAQDTANSALESVVAVESRVGSANTMATAGLIAGVLGILVGGGALLSSRRR